jgi:hypothetical protein
MKLFAKSPMQMRREAEARANAKCKRRLPNPGKLDPASGPCSTAPVGRLGFAPGLSTRVIDVCARVGSLRLLRFDRSLACARARVRVALPTLATSAHRLKWLRAEAVRIQLIDRVQIEA